MSLIHLNSQNQDPAMFFNQFPNGLKIPRNSEVCLVGFSGKLKFVPETLTINESNDTITFTLNDPEQNQLLRPMIAAKIKHGTYNSKAALATKIQDALNEAEPLSCFKGGHIVNYTNDKFVFETKYYKAGNMNRGEWNQWFGSNPTPGGSIDICGNEHLITCATGAFNYIDKNPLWNCDEFITSGTATANPQGAYYRINIKNDPIPVPTFVPDIIPTEDLHWKGFFSSSPSAFLTPGEFGMNILPTTPFDQITQLFINTTDIGGANYAPQLGDANYILGRYLTIVSKDLTIPGRQGVYGWIRIDSIVAFVPPAPSPPTAANLVAYNITFFGENLSVPNPPYNGSPLNFFTTEKVDLIFREWTGTPVPSQQLQMQGGIVCNPHVNYGWEQDTTAISNANIDWANSGMSLNQKGCAKPQFGWRIDNSYNLIAFESEIETDRFNQNDTPHKETFVHTIDISDASTNTLEIVIRPIQSNILGEKNYDFQLLYRTDISLNFTNGHIYTVSETFNVHQHLPIYQVLAFNDVDDAPVFVKGLHHLDTSGGLVPLSGTTPKMNYGFGRISKNNYPSMPDTLLNYINNNSNSKEVLNFEFGSYKVVSDASLNSTFPYSDVSPSSNPNILIHLPTLPIDGYVGAAAGGNANLVGVASGVNVYNIQDDLYEQFNVQNWIKLNNQEELHLTKLDVYLTDVYNRKIQFLDLSTSVWLKFRSRKGELSV